MPISYIVLKVLNKLKLRFLFYPIIYFFNIIFASCYHLPSIHKAHEIILKYSYHNFPKQTYKDHITNITCKKKYDLQIIVPVYNSEKYISRCLNSLINQRTEYSFQIIVVNDGSTDNTLSLLRKYSKNPLIKVKTQNNLGRACARNRGLDCATNSEYIMFVDSDDRVPSNAVQDLLHNAYVSNSDISLGSYDITKNDKVIHSVRYPYSHNIHLKVSSDLNGYLWGKVFKASLFKKVRFPAHYEFEDTILAFWIYPKCNKINSIKQVVYLYNDNPSSISNNFISNDISIDSFRITKLIVELLPKHDISIDQYLYNTFLSQVKMNCIRNNHEQINIQKSIFVLTRALIYKYFNGCRTNIKSYKYLEYSIRNNNYGNYILSCIME